MNIMLLKIIGGFERFKRELTAGSTGFQRVASARQFKGYKTVTESSQETNNGSVSFSW